MSVDSEQLVMWTWICDHIRTQIPKSSEVRCEIAAIILLLKYSQGEMGTSEQHQQASEELRLMGVLP